MSCSIDFNEILKYCRKIINLRNFQRSWIIWTELVSKKGHRNEHFYGSISHSLYTGLRLQFLFQWIDVLKNSTNYLFYFSKFDWNWLNASPRPRNCETLASSVGGEILSKISWISFHIIVCHTVKFYREAGSHYYTYPYILQNHARVFRTFGSVCAVMQYKWTWVDYRKQDNFLAVRMLYLILKISPQ